MLSVAHRKGRVRLRVVDPDANVVTLDPDDFDEPPFAAGVAALPEPFDPRNRIVQRRLAGAVRKAELRHGPGGATGARSRPVHDATAAHPVAECPDLANHLEVAAERDRLRARLRDVDSRVEERSSSLARQFDKLVALLERRGFVDGWAVTERGLVLSRLFHEDDLLAATIVYDGLLDDLSPAELAGVVSCLTYEHRSKEPPPPPWFPTPAVRERVAAIEQLAVGLSRDLTRAGLPVPPAPDPTFVAAAHAWAAGGSLDLVIGDELVTGGDFVRNIRTLIDLLRQIAGVAHDATRRAAIAAADALFHGVVAASSELTAGEAQR